MKTILDLPAEIVAIVCQSLLNRDIKQLRLASTELAERAELRIDRVYIAPNRADLDCLNHILDHPVYRLRVREIVWDVGQLIEFPLLEDFHEAIWRARWCANMALTTYADVSLWFSKWKNVDPLDFVGDDGRLTDHTKEIVGDADDPTYQAILARDLAEKTNDAATMSEEESYLLYQKLCQDEREIIRRGWDANGLQRALTELPNVQRITLANGTRRSWHVFPTYETPFFRALPAILRSIKSWAWSDATFNGTEVAGHLPSTYRGYSIMMSSLTANPPPNLQEFVMDPEHDWLAGLPSGFLQATNIDYANTLHMLSGSRIRKICLSIRGSNHQPHGDSILLQNIISAAPCLESLDLSFREPTLSDDTPVLFDAGFLHRQCSNLKHMTLHAMKVDIVWLFEVITQTRGLQTCILNMINIVGNGDAEHFAEDVLFNRLKNYFITAAYRGPQFTWRRRSTYVQVISVVKRCEVLDDHLNTFVYDGGETPFNSVADADTDPPSYMGPKPYKTWSIRIEALETVVWHYHQQYGSIDRLLTSERA
jgi:hypothetical protein